jgi:hypothetical protein
MGLLFPISSCPGRGPWDICYSCLWFFLWNGDRIFNTIIPMKRGFHLYVGLSHHHFFA